MIDLIVPAYAGIAPQDWGAVPTGPVTDQHGVGSELSGTFRPRELHVIGTVVHSRQNYISYCGVSSMESRRAT